MPNYTVKVIVTWPVNAVDPKDAVSTVPLVVKVKHISTETGLTEVLDTEGKVVLTAELVTERNRNDQFTLM